MRSCALTPNELLFEVARRLAGQRAGELQRRRRSLSAAVASCSENRTRKNPRAGSSWPRSGRTSSVIWRGTPSMVTVRSRDLHVDALARGAIERGPELDPQLGPDEPEEIARELAATDLQVLPGALGHVHDLVVLRDHDRRRRVLLERRRCSSAFESRSAMLGCAPGFDCGARGTWNDGRVGDGKHPRGEDGSCLEDVGVLVEGDKQVASPLRASRSCRGTGSRRAAGRSGTSASRAPAPHGSSRSGGCGSRRGRGARTAGP